MDNAVDNAVDNAAATGGQMHSTESHIESVAHLLSSADILLDLDASTKTRLFEEVGRLFEQRHGVSGAHVVRSLTERETLGSTGLGLGIALPHARIRNLPHPVAAFVRLKLPIAFDAPDDKPVSHMVILLVPQQATEHHLHLLAEIAQMFGDRNFRERMRGCDDADAVCRLFSDWARS
jgi:PTS system nitrogen regulatory IIA component